MPPVTVTLIGGNFKFCALNEAYNRPFLNNPNDNILLKFLDTKASYESTYTFNFKCNNIDYTSIKIIQDNTTVSNRKMYYNTASTETLVYQGTNWIDEKYKNISFETQSTLSGAYAFLSADLILYDTSHITRIYNGGYAIEKGTYKFKDTFSISYNSFSFNSFKSNGQSFQWLDINNNSNTITYSYAKSDTSAIVSVTVYENGTWVDEKYKTIILEDNCYFNSTRGNDTSYLFQVVEKVSQVTIDLTTLSGWGNVTNGSHNIQVVAKADNYRDSEKSTAVSFTKAPQVYTDCLTFTGKTSEFTLKATKKTWDGTLEWSTDHSTWTTLTGTEAMQSVGKKLYLRGKGNTTFYDSSSYSVNWVLSEKADCSGNIQTLLNWENPPTNIPTNNCYRGMFEYCSNLTSAPELPATTLAENCYRGMFWQCSNLTSAPKLPATTLAKFCYWQMFYGCAMLTSAPELPATTLVDGCYYYMFYNCDRLKVNTTSGNKIFTCPSIPTAAAVNYMFKNTGGSFTGTPTAGNTYYWTA